MFCANDIHVLSSKKKVEFLRPLEATLGKRSDLPDLQLITRSKVCACVVHVASGCMHTCRIHSLRRVTDMYVQSVRARSNIFRLPIYLIWSSDSTLYMLYACCTPLQVTTCVYQLEHLLMAIGRKKNKKKQAFSRSCFHGCDKSYICKSSRMEEENRESKETLKKNRSPAVY